MTTMLLLIWHLFFTFIMKKLMTGETTYDYGGWISYKPEVMKTSLKEVCD